MGERSEGRGGRRRDRGITPMAKGEMHSALKGKWMQAEYEAQLGRLPNC
jgi:hypothetical protein